MRFTYKARDGMNAMTLWQQQTMDLKKVEQPMQIHFKCVSNIVHSHFRRMLTWRLFSAPNYFPSKHLSIIIGSSLQQALQSTTQLLLPKSLRAHWTPTSLFGSMTRQSRTRISNGVQKCKRCFLTEEYKVQSFTSNTTCKCNVHPV